MCGMVIQSSAPIRYAVVDGMNVQDSRMTTTRRDGAARRPSSRRFSGEVAGVGALRLQRVWSPALWSVGARCALLRLRPVLSRTLLSGPGACVLRLILRRYPTLGIRRRHLAMPRLAILRRRRAMPSRPALPLETQWRIARSGTGLITRKPEPISGPTANVITAPERSLREGEALFLLRRVTASRGGSSRDKA
jgi:hypothetical protein